MFRSLATAVALILAASPAFCTPRLLVISKENKTLEVFDGTTYEPQFTVKIPGAPHEVVVSPDGKFAYSSDYDGLDNTITIVDLDAREKVGSINVKPSYKPHSLAITRDGSTLYATCEASRAVVEVDLKARAVKRTFKLRDDLVHVLALSPDEKWIYATSQWNGTVSFIDLEKGELDLTRLSGKGCEGIAVTNDGKEIWTVNRVLQSLSVFDAAKREREMTIPCVGNPIRITFTPDSKTALVSCSLQNQIALVDRATRKELTRIEVGNYPIGIAVAPDGKRYFVTSGRGSDVVVVDAVKRQAIKHIPVGPNPEGVAYTE